MLLWANRCTLLLIASSLRHMRLNVRLSTFPHVCPPLCRTNLKYYAVLLAVATSGLVLLLVTGHLAPANVLGFCIAFSNAYGLVAGALLNVAFWLCERWRLPQPMYNLPCCLLLCAVNNSARIISPPWQPSSCSGLGSWLYRSSCGFRQTRTESSAACATRRGSRWVEHQAFCLMVSNVSRPLLANDAACFSIYFSPTVAGSPPTPTQAERALAAHRRLSAAVLTARRASVLFAAHDPLRPLMDAVLDLANSVGKACCFTCALSLHTWHFTAWVMRGCALALDRAALLRPARLVLGLL